MIDTHSLHSKKPFSRYLLVCLFALIFLVSSRFTFAASDSDSQAIELLAFNSEQERSRYYALINELRCPKCQNQNLADSDAPIAEDLRKQLYELLQQGKSDTEILNFMTTRYGSFVLYEPPLNMHTVILWGLPALLFLGGAIAIFAYAKRNASPDDVQNNDETAESNETLETNTINKDLDSQIAHLKQQLQQTNNGKEQPQDD